MHGRYLGLGIILFLTVLAGCTDPPAPPISTIPIILMDYIEETQETKVFVHAIDDHLFSNISIQINDDEIFENFTYELHMATSLEEYALNVSVWDQQKLYEYRGNITLIMDDDITLHITDLTHSKPFERSFPYEKIMERVET